MRKTSRMLVLLVLLIGAVTSVWADDNVDLSTGGTNGEFSFFSAAECNPTAEIKKALPGSVVYIKATPDAGYTAKDISLPTAATTFAPGDSEYKPDVPVTAVDGKVAIYQMTLPNDILGGSTVTVSGVFAEPEYRENVPYVDVNGDAQTAEKVYLLDETQITLKAGCFYMAPDDYVINNTIKCEGDGTLSLIIPDGSILQCGSDEHPVNNSVFSMSQNLHFYGQEGATGRLYFRTKSEFNVVGIDGSIVTTYLDVDIVNTGSYGGALSAGSNGGGSIFLGHPTNGNMLTLRTDGCGISGGSLPITIKYCDVEITGATQDEAGEWTPCRYQGISGNSSGAVGIFGRAETGNTVKVRSTEACISSGGIPITIENCDLDLVSTENDGINCGGGGAQGMHITGRATGAPNTVLVRANQNGIMGGGATVDIKYCDIIVTGNTKDAKGEYEPCTQYGIYASSSGTSLTLEGRTDYPNWVSVRSNWQALGTGGCAMHISNYDVDVVSTDKFGIDCSGGGELTITGRDADAHNTVMVRSNQTGIFGGGSSVTVKYCDVIISGATQDEAGEWNPCDGYGVMATINPGITFEGRADGTNWLSVRSTKTALSGKDERYDTSEGRPVFVKYYDLDLISTEGSGIRADGRASDDIKGAYIEGVATGEYVNHVTIRAKNYGINTDGGYPVVIKNCGVIITGATQTDSEYDPCAKSAIYAGNPQLTIEGLPTGVNTVQVLSTEEALYGTGASVYISNCDVEAISTGKYAFVCYGTEMKITGLAEGGNRIVARGCGNLSAGYGVMMAGGSSVTINNCDVEVTAPTQNSEGEYNPCSGPGIYATNGFTINGLAAGGSRLYVRSEGNAVSAPGSIVSINNCDVDVVSVNGMGIWATSWDGVNLTSTLEDGNIARVKSKEDAMRSNGSGGLTIENYTVEAESDANGIYVTSGPLSINGADVTIESKNNAIYAVYSTVPTSITNSRLTATATGEKVAEEDAHSYDAIYAPYGISIDGSQVTVTAQDGYKGIFSSTSDINLSWQHDDDFIQVSSYCVGEDCKIKIVDGKTFMNDGDPTQRFSGVIEDTRDADELVTSCAIDGLMLVPPYMAVLEDEPGTYVKEMEVEKYKVMVDETTAPATVICPPDPEAEAPVATLTYARTLSVPVAEGDTEIDETPANLYTVCLPDAPVVEEGMTYYTLTSVAGAVLTFTEVTTPVAKTPYLVAVSGTDNKALAYSLDDVALWADVSTNDVTVENYTFKGTLTGLSNAQAAGAYILQGSGKWGLVPAGNDDIFIPPFRAYIVSTSEAPLRLATSFDETATAITNIRTVDKDGTEAWYDLTGRRVAKPVKAGVYVKDGKKIFVK